MDAGFYRGTSTDQDIRFTDKERKLLKQMRFEQVLDMKVDMQKVNLNVIKPWITLKLNEILGMEDDVVVEYVFTQLEDRDINPKKIQINLAGFLNAKRAREFMGELWQMFVEAQNSPEGIPASLVEKKVMELKIASASKPAEQTYAKATEVDWQHRYKSLTGGRYGKLDPRSYEVDYKREGSPRRSRERSGEREPARRRDSDEDRLERAERRLRYEEQRFKERKDLLREKQRKEEREVRRRKPSPSSEDGSPPLASRRLVENAENSSTKNTQERKRGRNDDEGHKKASKRSRKRHSSGSNSDDDEDRRRKKTKRHHKKDKKSRKHKDRD
uniref:PWI domain-containing protein n=3 Tax=Meloidogyne TaxID=189290 RepID=A0A914LF20_MELIC